MHQHTTKRMKTIENREDVNYLVNAFYAKIRRDELLGPIFNKHIAEGQWPEHIEKLTDFWVGNLFGVRIFKGNPAMKHVMVDQGQKQTIEQLHFDQWLQLWFETIDTHFEGQLAEGAKLVATRIGGSQLRIMHSSRQ